MKEKPRDAESREVCERYVRAGVGVQGLNLVVVDWLRSGLSVR